MSFFQYLQDTRSELRHVAWPTQTQTIVFTVLVIALSIFISVYLGIFDYIFTGIVERFVNASGGAPVTFEPVTSTSSAVTSTTTILQ